MRFVPFEGITFTFNKKWDVLVSAILLKRFIKTDTYSIHKIRIEFLSIVEQIRNLLHFWDRLITIFAATTTTNKINHFYTKQTVYSTKWATLCNNSYHQASPINHRQWYWWLSSNKNKHKWTIMCVTRRRRWQFERSDTSQICSIHSIATTTTLNKNKSLCDLYWFSVCCLPC